MDRKEIIVAKIPVRGPHPETPEGYTKINCTSRCKKWGKLSPTMMGPFSFQASLPISGSPELGFKISDVYPGYQEGNSTCLENYWQASKVFSPVDIPKGVELTNPSQLPMSFFERRDTYFKDPKWHRRIYTKSDKQDPVGSYHNGNIWKYIPSRYFYIWTYKMLVEGIPEFHELKSMNKLFIVDFDGPPGIDEPRGQIELPREEGRLRDLMYNPRTPFGHGLVLGSILAGIDLREIELLGV
jgi:hypothetical protein